MNFKNILKSIFAPEGFSCVYCKKEIPKSYIPACKSCLEKEHELLCHNFFGNVLYTARYSGVIRDLVLECKFRCHPSYAKYIAYLMHKTLMANGIKADIITYIPMHEKKMKQRGYDQAFLIAQELGKITGTEVKTLLVRTRETRSLFPLSSEQRKKEMKGAFVYAGKESLSGKTVLLTDDILTTGASMSEGARILEGKKAEVINFAFAKRDN